MKRSREVMKHFIVATAAATLLLGTAPAAIAQPKPSSEAVQEAKQRYQRGVELFNEGADAAARTELERAYALVQNYKILYNLGLVQLQLSDFVGAIRSFDGYLRDGGSEVPEGRRSEVQGHLTRLRPRVATVDIQSNQPETEISVDDIPLGKTPFSAATLMNPGRHKVTASKSGYVTDTKSISTAGSDTLTVSFDMKEPVVPPPLTASTLTPAPTVQPSTPVPTGVYVGWTATGVLAVGAVASGLIALQASSNLSDAKKTFPGNASDISTYSSRTKTWAAVSDVCTGLAVVTGALSLYFTLKSGPSSQVGVNVGPGNMALKGTF